MFSHSTHLFSMPKEPVLHIDIHQTKWWESRHAEAETPILWAPDEKNWLTGKDPDAGKDWRREKGTTEDEMVGWHHRRNGREFEQAPGVGDGQGGLACCSPWGRKESDTTKQLNWTEMGGSGEHLSLHPVGQAPQATWLVPITWGLCPTQMKNGINNICQDFCRDLHVLQKAKGFEGILEMIAR